MTNHFTGTKFPNQSDISSAVGAFAVGFVSNLYGRFFEGNAFVVMVSILFPALLFFIFVLTCENPTDHRHPLPTPLGPRKRRLVQLCLGPGLWLECVVLERVRHGAAVDQYEYWIDGGSGHQFGGCTPDSE